MKTRKVVSLGFYVPPATVSGGFSYETFMNHLSNKRDIYGRILLTIHDYLIKYSKTFDEVHYCVTAQLTGISTNDTLKGLIRLIHEEKIDIAVQPVIMGESTTKRADFSYPYKIHSTTFVTRKPEYKPEMFGILQTFSWPLWFAIFSIFISMSLLYYVSLKRRYAFDKVSLHSFAVLLRQSSILRPSSIAEQFLLCSWVVGAMFFCLAFDSVFLSFLAFPPMNPIKQVSQLAKAVINGDYHCIAPPESSLNSLLIKSKQEDLRILGKDIEKNNLSNDKTFEGFLYENISQNIAVIIRTDVVDILSVGNKFVPEERFLQSMAAMMVRKDFCCKKVIDTFVHRLVASGLYSKYESDRSFLFRLPLLLKYQEKDSCKRKLSITDVASAFIILITGYFVSFSVLIIEILTNRKKKVNYLKKTIKRRLRVS